MEPVDLSLRRKLLTLSSILNENFLAFSEIGTNLEVSPTMLRIDWGYWLLSNKTTPRSLSQISKFFSKHFSDTTSLYNTKPTFYISITYFGSQSDELSRELSRLLSKYKSHIKFIIIQVNRHKIGSLFNYKDRLPSFMRSSIVYRFSCARCACEYVGSTTRSLQTRVCEHIGKSHRTVLPLSTPQHSNIRLHCDCCRVSVNETDFSILSGYERNSETLLILKFMYISKMKPWISYMNIPHKLLVGN